MAESDGSNPAPAAPPPGDPAPAAPSAPARPEYLPEKFWDAAAGAPRVDALAKSYSELEKQRAKFAESARAEVTAELRAGVPEKADGYEIKAPAKLPDGLVWLDEMPADFKPEPGKTYFKPDPSSPVMAAAREWAHANGVKGEAFQDLMGLAAQVLGTRVPTPEEQQAARSEFLSSLGENGEARATHLWGQLQATLGAKAEAINALLGDKAGFEAIEALVVKAGGASFASAPAAQVGQLSEDEIRAKMRDPRYVQRDPAFVREVTEDWQKLCGGTQVDGVLAPFARRR